MEALDLALFNWGQPSAGRVTMGSAASPDDEIRGRIADALA